MGFEPHQPPSRVEVVNEFTDRMKTTLEEAKAALAKAKDEMARYYKSTTDDVPRLRYSHPATKSTSTRPTFV